MKRLVLCALGALAFVQPVHANDGLPAAVAAGWAKRTVERVPWTAVVAAEPELPEWTGEPEQRLALAVAKVAANEGVMIRSADVALVWQVTRSHGETDTERLSWLRAHSRRVLGDECDPEAHANCMWTRNLRWGPWMPEGWTDRYPSGLWRPNGWMRVLRLALDLVEGRTYFEPCYRAPYTWGGRMDVRDAIKRKGLIPLSCSGSLNEGFIQRSALAPG